MNGINAQAIQVNTQEIIAENINLFTAVAKAKNITFTTNIPEDVFVWADENHFHLLLRNLINNAIKFTTEGGQIKVATQQKQTKIEISITDNGVGMTAEQMANLFKKNQNATTYGTSGEKGTGLGLQLCQEIVVKNGGKIWVNSTKDKGSTFTFSLPMTA
jgi:signal transduction histidine kinase